MFRLFCKIELKTNNVWNYSTPLNQAVWDGNIEIFGRGESIQNDSKISYNTIVHDYYHSYFRYYPTKFTIFLDV